MPQYSLNPNNWIKPPDITGAYAKGYGLGSQAGEIQARIAMERARLDQQSQHAAMSLALESQKQERDSMVEQQRLEIAKAYHQQEAELGHQKLDQAEQMVQQKIKDAAARSLAMENFKQAIANKVDPIQAVFQNINGLPAGMGSAALKAITGTEKGNAFTFLQSQRDKAYARGDTQAGDELAGRVQKLSGTDDQSRAKSTLQSIAAAKLRHIDAELLKPENSEAQARKNKTAFERRKALIYDRLDTGNQLNDISSTSTIATPGASSAPAPATGLKILPLPPKGQEGIDGGLYYTPKGVLQYNKEKKQYLPPTPQASAEPEPSDTEVADSGMPPEEDAIDSENA